jgi:hypothetical protein
VAPRGRREKRALLLRTPYLTHRSLLLPSCHEPVSSPFAVRNATSSALQLAERQVRSFNCMFCACMFAPHPFPPSRTMSKKLPTMLSKASSLLNTWRTPSVAAQDHAPGVEASERRSTRSGNLMHPSPARPFGSLSHLSPALRSLPNSTDLACGASEVEICRPSRSTSASISTGVDNRRPRRPASLPRRVRLFRKHPTALTPSAPKFGFYASVSACIKAKRVGGRTPIRVSPAANVSIQQANHEY